MKRRAIHAELRKESQTFEGWLKYEVTIQNEDGTTSKIPAYGKDLQDALSRVVHDERVYEIEKKTKKIPDLVWVILWFGYVFGWTMLTYEVSEYDKFDGLFFVSGLLLVTTVILWVKRWFRIKNREK